MLDKMARLRDTATGCPWDVEQSFASIAPYTIEEAYEVADAIDREDWPALKTELGDLLFQVVFHARMASERGLFGFDEVVESISEKMVRRHPHVFADGADVNSAAEQTVKWEELKAQERRDQSRARGADVSALDGISANLPALTRTRKIHDRVAGQGFGLASPGEALEDVISEVEELSQEIADGTPERVADELGDILFATVNLARHLDVDPESALRLSAARFEKRFRFIERRLSRDNRTISDCPADELDALWTSAKDEEAANR
ncbi:MAG: nucleoside triphosphate pyrophosphohydrolase [bacterium]|nr:nucleoside triphosphate pyrophosphohydrolase [bacterium]